MLKKKNTPKTINRKQIQSSENLSTETTKLWKYKFWIIKYTKIQIQEIQSPESKKSWLWETLNLSTCADSKSYNKKFSDVAAGSLVIDRVEEEKIAQIKC